MSVCLFTRQASLDLLEIHDYIAQNSPQNAARFLDRLEEKCRFLAENPKLGQNCPALAEGLSSFPEGNYLIFYKSASTGIVVVRVLSGFRDLESLFGE
jgi:plasmid stabilization system protein ParE